MSNAKEAAIILVDSTTESGKRLIRTWGHDASKVVLEHTWARASVVAGRPLLEVDNWGGAMTVDDGKPVTIDGVVVDEDELDEVEALVTKSVTNFSQRHLLIYITRSPLPTPRVTPVDPASHGPENTVTEHRLESNISGPPKPGPPKAQPVTVDTIISEEPMVIINDNIKPLQSPPPSAAQPLSYPHPTLFAQPSQPQNAYTFAPYSTQQSYPSSQSQIMPTQPFSHTPQPQVVHAPSVPHTPLPSVQSLATQMTSNMTSADGLNFQNQNLAAIMTIMEVVRRMDNSSWFGQNQLPASQPPANSNTSMFPVQPPATPGPAPSISTLQVTRKFESPGVDASMSSSQGHLSDTATSSRKYESVTEVSEDRPMTRKSRAKLARRLPDETLTPSISRKRPPAVKPTNPPPKRLRKGKEKVNFSDSSEVSESDELMEVSDGSCSCSTRSSASPPTRPRKIIARKKHGEIFVLGGQPLRFFVQVDLHGRHTVVANIKVRLDDISQLKFDTDYFDRKTRERLLTISQMPTI